LCFRWAVGTSYRVAFGQDPMTQKGGGLLSHFVPVPGTIYLTDDAKMEVCTPVLMTRFCCRLKVDTNSTNKN